MTQVELARASGVARGMISDYEAGSRQPLPSTLHKLLLAMEGDFRDLQQALFQARGETPLTRPPNNGPPPMLSSIREQTTDLQTREIDRRVAEIAARVIRELTGFEPDTPDEPANKGSG